MNHELYRLADHTLIEPLVHSWSAWWMTVAPVPACLHVRNVQTRVMRSYLQNPDAHERFSKDPTITANSFMNVPASRKKEVDDLLRRTEQEFNECLKLAEAYEQFYSVILTEAKGQSLEPFYASVPEPLKGLVELNYDYYNRPFVRVLEGAAYRSRYYKPNLQSLRISRLESYGSRPFIISTPRLCEPGDINWPVEFRDPRVDRLYSMDLKPARLGEIVDLIGQGDIGERLSPHLTTEPARVARRWDGGGVRVRYLGHATVLIEWKGLSILMDPVVPVRPTTAGAEQPCMSFQDLPERIDFVLVTHGHTDHFELESLLRLRHRIGCLVVPRSGGMLCGDVSLKTLARMVGFDNVIDVDAYDSIRVHEDGEIIAVPFLGEHGDIAHAKAAYVIRLGKEVMLFAADSQCLDEATYRDMRASVGQVNSVFMSTETEGAPLTFGIEALFPKGRDRKIEKSRRCRGSNAKEGLSVVELLGARRIYNYAMGFEPWIWHILGSASPPDSPRLRDSDAVLAESKARGLHAERICGPLEFVIEV